MQQPHDLSAAPGVRDQPVTATAQSCTGRLLPYLPLPTKLRRTRGTCMRIEIICTGDEVLTGKITNTNFSYMAQKLEDVGLSVYWGPPVGDARDPLLSPSQLAPPRADAVIVNGGLGPTID